MTQISWEPFQNTFHFRMLAPPAAPVNTMFASVSMHKQQAHASAHHNGEPQGCSSTQQSHVRWWPGPFHTAKHLTFSSSTLCVNAYGGMFSSQVKRTMCRWQGCAAYTVAYQHGDAKCGRSGQPCTVQCAQRPWSTMCSGLILADEPAAQRHLDRRLGCPTTAANSLQAATDGCGGCGPCGGLARSPRGKQDPATLTLQNER